MKDPPPKELIISSPASRELCESCARYNWLYHLTRHVPSPLTNALFQYEEALVKQVIRSGEATYVEKVDELHHEKWYDVSNAPYLGLYYVNETGGNTHFSPGPLNVKTSSSRCSFCNLLHQAAQKAGFELPHLAYFSCWFWNPRKDLNQDPYVLVIQLQDEKWKKAYKYGLRLALLGREETEVFSRPIADPCQINLDILKKWRERCDTEHGDCCARFSLGPDGLKRGLSDRPMSFRVIDVKTDRVVPAPTNCPYFALSYVWGGAVPFKLNKADIAFTPADFPSFANSYAQLHRHRLPCTIQDVMFLVELLGERYLWVDCLCIVQNDLDDLKRNIHGMARIFSAANLTIVAASGGDANAGLPGLYPGTRQIWPTIGSIEKVGLVEIEPPLSLESTIWGSRGWTYQEYQFSPRTMIFTNQRVYFQCRRGFRGEVRPSKLWFGPPKTHLRNFDIIHSSPFGKYEQHVKDYSRKDLTYESDVLNAFTAVMEDYALENDTEFCWGLPLQLFSLALLWVNEVYYSREVTSLRRRKHESSYAFPSWSWAGWVGAVQFDLHESPISFASNITFAVIWPWDKEYDIVTVNNPFVTGVLTIQVELAVIDLKDIAYEDKKYCRFDNGKTDPVCVECFLLGIISNQVKTWKTVESIRNNYIVIAVERHESGIYYRKGVMRVTKSIWNASKSEKRYIQLG